MDQRPEVSWTCPDCQARNATVIAPDTEAGEIVDVGCRVCGTEHEAFVFFALTPAGTPITVGIVWV